MSTATVAPATATAATSAPEAEGAALAPSAATPSAEAAPATARIAASAPEVAPDSADEAARVPAPASDPVADRLARMLDAEAELADLEWSLDRIDRALNPGPERPRTVPRRSRRSAWLPIL